jgi:hypothetical protein
MLLCNTYSICESIEIVRDLGRGSMTSDVSENEPTAESKIAGWLYDGRSHAGSSSRSRSRCSICAGNGLIQYLSS